MASYLQRGGALTAELLYQVVTVLAVIALVIAAIALLAVVMFAPKDQETNDHEDHT